MRINTRLRFTFFIILWIGFVLTSTMLTIRVYNFVRTSSLWQINHVVIEGLKRVSRDEILRIIDLSPGVSLWDISLPELEKKLLKHQWIEKAVIKWRFPGVISITVVERYPVAVLCCDTCFYVDDRGRGFSRVDRQRVSHYDVPWFNFCPPDRSDSKEALEISPDILSSFSILMKTLRNDFSHSWGDMEISYSTEYGFVLSFSSLRALIGTSNISNNVAKLQYIMQRLGLANREEGPKEIDLRYTRWVFVR
ncbi:MAG: FtsQ-type POTRA domain-containing protein [Syntrophobacterales bacterium]|nr:FtsQ-type POTRA domain-containing protein [Syntrophobacterales bacterium]